jgi:tetratricopeptide (TPR) repeat protein
VFDEPRAAIAALEKALKLSPFAAEALLEKGLAEAAAGESRRALNSVAHALSLKSDFVNAWRALADELMRAGDEEAAGKAYASHVTAATKDPDLLKAGQALAEGKLAIAERQLKQYLMRAPTDVAAIRMLAELAARIGRYVDAENLLERCVELAPDFDAARHNLAIVALRQGRAEKSIAEVERLLGRNARDPGYRTLYCAALSRIGDYDKALPHYRALLADHPRQSKTWLSFGHALKTVGKQTESISAYRKSIELQPSLGEAYWSLANLKTVRFSDDDIKEMTAQLERDDLNEDDRLHLHFALGKALEDAALYEESFGHYAEGNRLRRKGIPYDADETTAHVRRNRAFFTPAFIAERSGWGSPAPDPIFIVGLPRAGSTLVEQILSCHSAVEGTMELPDVIGIARRLGGRQRKSEASKYPEVLATLDEGQLRSLGEQYLAQTRIQRKTGAPRFIDKMPNNWAHVGLIHLMLPNAKIVDARRHPMSCCFSGFKQHFARGQHFTYGLEDIGRYYRDYVGLMAHFDEVLPGRVHRVIYERMVEDTETEVRRLLEYCGLPFEDACLRFYENDRAVRTASSEQVRQPIYRDAVEQWRHYEQWLVPLEAALGPVLGAYPAAPENTFEVVRAPHHNAENSKQGVA